MPVMKKGFYWLGGYIYYGHYPEKQVAGGGRLSSRNSKFIRTDIPFSEEDIAVRLKDNHALTEQELVNLEQACLKLMGCMNVYKFNEVDFMETEQRLGIELPKEIKLLYRAICRVDSLMSGSERFLPLNELYIDSDNLVFYKVKRTPVAFSLSEGVLMNYYKKEWECNWGNANFLCFALERIVVKAIMGMPLNKKGTISGELRSMLSPREPLREIFKGKLNVLDEYINYGHVILFNENGALGWFRQNGMYADILIGCSTESILADLLATNLSVKWK